MEPENIEKKKSRQMAERFLTMQSTQWTFP